MRLLHRVADTSVTGRKDAIALSAQAGLVQLEIHELVHVLQDHHVTVEQDDAAVLGQGEERQLGPGLVEPSIVVVELLVDRRKKVSHPPSSYAPHIEGLSTLFREAVGVQGQQRVLGRLPPERMGQRQEAWQVVGVGDERGPH